MDEELSEAEQTKKDWFIAITKNDLKKFELSLWVALFLVFFVIVYMSYGFWKNSSIEHLTTLLIAAQFMTVFGALLTVVGTFLGNSTITLLSIKHKSDDLRLFFSFMRSRSITEKGLIFVGLGFIVTILSMLINAIRPF
jgi:hypothetical protein